MKKKRFIKLLMAKGIDRNTANMAAACLLGGRYGVSYADVYRVACLFQKACGLPFVYAVFAMGCPVSSPYWHMVHFRWFGRARYWRQNRHLLFMAADAVTDNTTPLCRDHHQDALDAMTYAVMSMEHAAPAASTAATPLSSMPSIGIRTDGVVIDEVAGYVRRQIERDTNAGGLQYATP